MRLSEWRAKLNAMVVETRYVQSGEVFVAYQVTGQPGPDLLIAPGFVSHLEHNWENAQIAHCHNALGAFSRLICFDKRGTGLSDRSVGVPHLDQRIDDIRAVLDATESRRSLDGIERTMTVQESDKVLSWTSGTPFKTAEGKEAVATITFERLE